MNINATQLTKIALLSFTLTVINIAAILSGYAVYYALRPINQLLIQIPVGLGASVIAFAALLLVIKHMPFRKLDSSAAGRGQLLELLPVSAGDYAWIFVGAMLWVPLIFLPLHFTTQGYVSSAGNIVGIWLFQLAANGIGLPGGHYLTSHNKSTARYRH